MEYNPAKDVEAVDDYFANQDIASAAKNTTDLLSAFPVLMLQAVTNRQPMTAMGLCQTARELYSFARRKLSAIEGATQLIEGFDRSMDGLEDRLAAELRKAHLVFENPDCYRELFDLEKDKLTVKEHYCILTTRLDPKKLDSKAMVRYEKNFAEERDVRLQQLDDMIETAIKKATSASLRQENLQGSD